MKPLIVANWKCNPSTLEEAKRLFNSVKRGVKNIKNVEVVICPPFVYLSSIKYQVSRIKLGAQDCFYEQKGAFTGEISPLMLKNLGCQYVIVGHSERRKYFNETDEMINKKIKATIITKLKPIFCIGETLKERERGEMYNVLRSQIEKGLQKIPKKEIKNIVVVYEPVWAIGSGKPCSPDTTMSVSLFIRKILTKIYSPSISKNLRIIYGGSVNSKNASSSVVEARIDGLLVGGASLDSQEFINIVRKVSGT